MIRNHVLGIHDRGKDMQFSDIPNVNQLLGLSIFDGTSKEWATHIVRLCTEEVRLQIRGGHLNKIWTLDDWGAFLKNKKEELSQGRYQRVINATGIVVHTNLGRAPISAEVLNYMTLVSQYTDLELQLQTGKRGGRISGIRDKLRQLTGAEDALVVNNNAAAVLLVLSAISSGREVIVSRGELVEIGGSFRVPDVIQQGGAILKEVGCTNRTRVSDFEHAISDQTGAILRVHPSNYQIVGFTERADRSELAELARVHNVPLIDDLGSGLLNRAPNVPWRQELEHEESIAEAIRSGVDLVCASGDKLLGGVQAGLIVGRADLIALCRSHPLYRAIRLDKMMLAGLEATLQIHLEGRASDLPVWHYLERTQTDCRRLAEKLVQQLSRPEVTMREDVSLVGGGASPERVLPTWVIEIATENSEDFAQALRTGYPAIMPRIQRGHILLDLRTIDAMDIEDICDRIAACL